MATLGVTSIALLASACAQDWDAFDFDGPAATACPGQPGTWGLDEARAARLRRGLVVRLWPDVAPSPAQDTGQLAPGLPGAAVLTRVAAEGARHLRLVYPARFLFDPDQPGTLPAPPFAILARSIDAVHAAGLAVVLAPTFELEFKQALAREDGALEALGAHWSALGAALGGRDPQTLFFAVIDAPGLPEPSQWSPRAEALVTGLRAALPGRVLLVPAAEAIAPLREPERPALAELAPVTAVSEVVYEQSLFAPWVFTHQGVALAARPELERLSELEYPATRANLTRLRAGTDLPALQALLDDYDRRAWGPARVEEAVRALWLLARARCVPVQVSGLGVSALAPVAARRAWLADLRRQLDKYGLGWSAEGLAAPFTLDAELRAIVLR